MTIEDAKLVLENEYHIDNFTYVVKDVLLPDYVGDVHAVAYSNDIFSSVKQLGISDACELTVFEVYLKKGTQNRRVTITQEMFKILRGLRVNNALVAFVNADGNNFRISLLTSKYEFDGDKIVKVLSNPRRFSYTLGKGMKTRTAYKFLIKEGKVKDLNELIGRFSVEVVNKQFYAEIATSFTELVGGERNGKTYEKLLQLYGSLDHNKHAEFGVRLIGRIMFCWFLKEKRSESGVPLVPDDMLSIEKINSCNNYYHQVLEPLFFELLNTPINSRKRDFDTEYYNKIPYLNGGLFSPHTDDMYKYDPALHCGRYGQVTIPNEWFRQLYQTLGQYNFTVDENTAYDIELSIDPEMLGRIFENLLAEINPETGENAKKSTGSFYTPRDIVDYMVDSSLCEYMKTKTGIDEVKLKALISYSKEDEGIAVFDEKEKKSIIEALYTVTVLDPACGSGAFPIGMLQKIVYILQEIDPGADLWFDAMVKGAPIYVKQAFEKKFRNGELDYLRKITVIERSIYGIDIQPIAVEISRLRCFLSLIIEEKVDDAEENRNIKPLPNLDFKFIIANSLIPLEKDVAKSFLKSETGTLLLESQMNLFEDINHIDKLKEIREEFFTADSTRRVELKSEFQSLQQDMLIRTIQNSKLSTKEYEQLSRWKPFENKPTDWFDPEWMFGIKDGFDIVIANPPYKLCQPSNTAKTILDFYKRNYKVASYKIDLFHLFFEKGIILLKNRGVLSYISPNTYLANKYIKPLRKFILDHCTIKQIINHDKVFEDASVDTATIIMTKEFSDDYSVNILKSTKSLFCPICNKSQKEWRKDIDLVFNINRQLIQNYGQCIALGQICKTYFGIQAYDRSSSIAYEKQGKNYLPMIDGGDIIPYRWATPQIYFNYLPTNIKSGGDWNIYKQDRIVIRQIGQSPIVGLCQARILASNTLYNVTVKNQNYLLKYILACLNSKFIKDYWTAKYCDNKAIFPKIKGYQLQELPIPVISMERQIAITKTVDDIIKKYEESIDVKDELDQLNIEIDNLYKKI